MINLTVVRGDFQCLENVFVFISMVNVFPQGAEKLLLHRNQMDTVLLSPLIFNQV